MVNLLRKIIEAEPTHELWVKIWHRFLHQKLSKTIPFEATNLLGFQSELSLKKLFFKRIQSIQNTSLREGVVCVCVGESFELQLVDGLQENGVQRRQQRLVRRERAFEVRNVHRMSLKQKKVHCHCHCHEIELHLHVKTA